MIDPTLCFSAKNQIMKIVKDIVMSHRQTEAYTSEAEIYNHISDCLSVIENNCSSSPSEGYVQHIVNKYPLWISDEAYKQIRIKEMKSTITKMRNVAQTHVQKV